MSRSGPIRGDKSSRSNRRDEPYSFRITIDNNKQDSFDNISQQVTAVVGTSAKHSVSKPAATARPSVFARLGNTTQTVSGTVVLFEQLSPDVIKEDIDDLAKILGDVKSVEITRSSTDRGKNVAEVLFARRSTALECIAKYHGVKLDGVPMVVKLKGDNGKENPFNPVSVAAAPPEASNVRVGLFGTAISGKGSDVTSTHRVVENVNVPASNQRVTVNLGGQKEKVVRQKGAAQGKVGKPDKGRRSQVSSDDLDAQLDSYMDS